MKRIIIPSILLTGVLAVGSVGVRIADAETTYPPIVQRLSERFGLNEEDIQDVFDEVHDERQAEMMATWEERLNDLVSNGKITERQKQTLVDKHTELEEKIQTLRDKSPQERRDAMVKLHEEFTQWLSNNDIDLELVGPFIRGFNRGPRGGMMMLGR